jgi:hypothetical protein
MRNLLLVFVLLVSFCQCKNKKVSLQGDQKIEQTDFIDAFPSIELPYSIADTSLQPPADTTTISSAVFTGFVPDTIFINPFEKERKLTIYPVGRYEVKDQETYLIAYAGSRSKKAVYLIVLDKNKKFSAFLPLVTSNNDKDVLTTATLDKKLGVAIYNEWKVDETTYYQRSIYAYNNIGAFTLVLNETNDFTRKSVGEINPLDTFPKLNKYSGDYFKGKTNFISLRDGKNSETYLFYVHFENNGEEECGGELRGEMTMTSDKSAIYRENGDPCVIDFVLTGNQVKVKEQGSCGNYRGIRCFFNDTYTRKKEAKPAKKKK